MAFDKLRAEAELETRGFVRGSKEMQRELYKIEKASQKATRKSGQGFTQLAYALDDAQYGFRGVQNNLQAMAVQLGASGPVVLGITAVAVGINYLIENHEKLGIAIGNNTKQYEEFRKELGQVERFTRQHAALLLENTIQEQEAAKAQIESRIASGYYKGKRKAEMQRRLEDLNNMIKANRELLSSYIKESNALYKKAKAEEAALKAEKERAKFKNENAKDPAAGLGFLTGGGGLGLSGLLETPGLFKGKGAFGEDYTNPFKQLADSATFNKEKIKDANEEITESFDAAKMMLGGFMASLDDLSTGNFEGFAKSMISTAKQIAMAMAITAATKDGAKLGAIALPALIAMALGAVGSAFGKVGAGGGATGGGSVGHTRDTGVAANLASNVNGADLNAGGMVIRGSDLVYVTNKAAGQRYTFGGRG